MAQDCVIPETVPATASVTASATASAAKTEPVADAAGKSNLRGLLARKQRELAGIDKRRNNLLDLLRELECMRDRELDAADQARRTQLSRDLMHELLAGNETSNGRTSSGDAIRALDAQIKQREHSLKTATAEEALKLDEQLAQLNAERDIAYNTETCRMCDELVEELPAVLKLSTVDTIRSYQRQIVEAMRQCANLDRKRGVLKDCIADLEREAAVGTDPRLEPLPPHLRRCAVMLLYAVITLIVGLSSDAPYAQLASLMIALALFGGALSVANLI